MGEVETIDAQAADVDDDVEKLNVATEALEGCVGILDAAIQRGGLDVFGSSLLRNNVNTVTSMLKVKSMTLPALEDLETPTAKIDGAATAKDGIVAFIRRMMEALKQAFVRFGQWITETYKRLTNAFIAVERRAETLAQKVKAAKMVEGKISNKSLSAKMTVNGAEVKDLAQLIDRLGKLAATLNDPKTYAGYLEALDLCEQMIKDPSKEQEIRGKISAALSGWAGQMAKLNDGQIPFHVKGESASNTFNIAMLNNQILKTSIPTGADGVRLLSSTVVEGTGSSAGDIEALDQKAAEAICAKVAEVAKTVRESGESNKGGAKELINEIQKRKDTLAAMITATEKAVMEDSGIEATTVRKIVLFINTAFLAAPKLPVHAINKALPRNLNAALDLVAASIAGAAEPAPKQLAA
jgi:hypothetical protein